MNIMKNLLFAIAMIISIQGFAQQTPQAMIDQFFKTYQTDPGQALEDLYANCPSIDLMKEQVQKTVESLEGFTADYLGKYHGYDAITSNTFTDRLETHTYLVRYGKQPLRYTFRFYKPGDTWVLHSFMMDDDFLKERDSGK